jgi:AbrB family looped-hinge helix DNA binding protein
MSKKLKTFKITSKGQITIPKEIREKLGSSTVYFEMADDAVLIRPVKDVAASLVKYARNVKPGLAMDEIKEKAWKEAIREAYDGHS